MQMPGMDTYFSALVLLLSSYTCLCFQADVACNVGTVNGSVTPCSPLYNETLQLNCSTTQGIWFKTGSNHSVCQSNLCILSSLSFSESSGLYYCKTTDSIFFLNLTVKAPPEFLPFPNHTLVHTSDGYYYPKVSVTNGYNNPFVKLKVRVVGVGPFSIKWHLNYSQKEFCPPEGHNATVDCSESQVNDQETVFTLTLISVTNDYDHWMAGTYSAVVTNEYGSNTSMIEFEILCTPDPSKTKIISPSSYNNDLKLIKNWNASLHCTVLIFHLADLVMCYHYGDETSESIKQDNFPLTRCAVCSFDREGTCDADLNGKEDWNVLQEHFGDCNEERSITLNISSVSSDDDNLTVFCGYRINDEKMAILAEFDIHVTNAPFNWMVFTICIVVGLLLAVIFACVVIVLKCYIKQSRLKRKKKKRDERKERRSKLLHANLEHSDDDDDEPCVIVRTSIPVPASSAVASAPLMESPGSIQQPLLSPRSFAQSYGATEEDTDYPPSHIPSLSTVRNSNDKKV